VEKVFGRSSAVSQRFFNQHQLQHTVMQNMETKSRHIQTQKRKENEKSESVNVLLLDVTNFPLLPA
jgi:hypothetical protein